MDELDGWMEVEVRLLALTCLCWDGNGNGRYSDGWSFNQSLDLIWAREEERRDGSW